MKKMKNGWLVSAELTGNDQEGNITLFNSPLFSTEEGADKWYRELGFEYYELNKIEKGLDFVMIHYVNNEIKETYII